MLIATKSTNVQQQQQQQQQHQQLPKQQQHSDVTLIGSNVINKHNNKKQHDGDNKNVQLMPTSTTATKAATKLTEFASGRKEEAFLPCDSEAKQRHEALAKKWNMKYMHYKNNNNNNNNNNNKEFDKQQQGPDLNTHLNIRGNGGTVERARRGRRPNGRGVGNRGRGMYKGNVAATGKELPPNSLYAAAMLTVAKMKAKRGGDNNRVLRNSGGRGGNNNRAKARPYAPLIGSTTNSSASCDAKTTAAEIGGQNKRNH